MKSKIVLKLGGASLQNLGTLQELVGLIQKLRAKKFDVVLVHGGGPAINQELTRRGIEWQFINGQRQTTPEMMEVIESVLAGKINTMVVDVLKAANIPALSLSGASDHILQCVRSSEELLQVGSVEKVHVEVINEVLGRTDNPISVIAPIGFGRHGEKYNINADWAAVKIAIALKAEQLIFLTDQNGILDQNKQLIDLATPTLIHDLISRQVISGGMYTKAMTMLAALEAGIQKVRVLNAGFASQFADGISLGTLLVDESSQLTKGVGGCNSITK
ncbi:MAG: acetylglutamate kinase [Bdellovibrionaceae bacterium]|nr:acetylglutamate kinase [Pseudobdellovibrionaceae bacterium]